MPQPIHHRLHILEAAQNQIRGAIPARIAPSTGVPTKLSGLNSHSMYRNTSITAAIPAMTEIMARMTIAAVRFMKYSPYANADSAECPQNRG